MVRQLLQLVVYEPQGVDSSLRLLRNGIIDLLLDESGDAVHLTCQESNVLVCALDAVERRFSHTLVDGNVVVDVEVCRGRKAAGRLSRVSRSILLSWRDERRIVRRV